MSEQHQQVESRRHPWYKIHRLLNYWCYWLTWGKKPTVLVVICCLIGVVISWFLTLVDHADPTDQDLPSWAVWWAKLLHDYRLCIFLLLSFLQTMLASFVLLVNTLFSFNKAMVQEILDFSVNSHFPDQELDNHCYRATLFKLRGCPGIGSWLGIVCRSGHSNHISNTIFSVNLKKKNECTGIAGETVRQNAEIIRTLEPGTPEYSTNGYVAECELNTMEEKAKIFFSTPIRRQNGSIWGVLILDTTDVAREPGKNSEKRVKNDMGHWALALKSVIV